MILHMRPPDRLEYTIVDEMVFPVEVIQLPPSPRRGSRSGRNPKATKKVVPLSPIDREVAFAAQMFRLLGDPRRLRILLELRGRELPVFDLAIVADMTPSGASHALRLLRDNGIVKVRKVGKYAYYSLRDVRTERLLGFVFERSEARVTPP